jgi:uncharacterized membrane protein
MLVPSSWKTLMLLAIFCWGFWSFLGKVVMTRIGWASALALNGIISLILAFVFKPGAFHFQANYAYLLALIMSILGGFGTIYFYGALETGPASVVIPGTALYIVIAALLAIVVLGEAITFNRLAGLGLGLAAIYLLSRG